MKALRGSVTIILALIMALLLVCFSFAEAAPSVAKTYRFKFATVHPGPGHYWWGPGWGYADFKNEVEQRSAGKMIIDYYTSESLVKHREVHRAVAAGIADIGYTNPGYITDFIPLDEVSYLPWIGGASAEVLTVVYYEKLYVKYFKPFRDKLGLHQIGGALVGPMQLFTKSKPVKKIEDFKGLTTAVLGGKYAQKLMASLGVVGISVSTWEIYEALQKGVLEAACHHPTSIVDYKWSEVGKPGYLIDFGGIGAGSGLYFMNLKLYDSLPKEFQQIIDEAGYKHLSIGIAKMPYDQKGKESIETIRKGGVEIINWSADEKKRMEKEKFEPVWNEWASAMDAKGYAGSEVLGALKKATAESTAKGVGR